jgi:predicted dehydrogenase
MKIGIVGAGAMALRFLKAVKDQIEDVKFTGVHDIYQDQLDAFSQEYPKIKTYIDYGKMLSSSDVDAVYISTPVYTHALLTKQAAAAHKHILCEKPMAITWDDCVEMVSAAEVNGVVLQIGYMMRFHPYHRFIKQQIDSGELGSIHFIHLERTALIDFKSGAIAAQRLWFVNKRLSGGGAFMDLGSHLINLLFYFFGDDVQSYNLIGNIDEDLGVELSGLASLNYQSGTLATVLASWEVPLHDNIVQVYGEKASIQAMRTVGPYTDSKLEFIQDGNRQEVILPYENHYVKQLKHFRDCVLNGGEPITSGRICLASERMRINLLEQI